MPNKTVINAEKGKFDPEEKAIIFNPKLNFKGEAYIEIKYGDIIMPCKNCNISVRDIDWQQTKIVFSETINLGEISNLTIYPKPMGFHWGKGKGIFPFLRGDREVNR